jgi:hypothetical protein
MTHRARDGSLWRALVTTIMNNLVLKSVIFYSPAEELFLSMETSALAV